MLAAFRNAGRRFPQPLAFSTSAIVSQNFKASNGVNKRLQTILEDTGSRSAHPKVKLTTTIYPVFRDLKVGDIILPNDLTYQKAFKQQKIYRKAGVAPGHEITHQRDTFYQFGLDPRHFTKNGQLLSHFVTEMGKIKSRDQTVLTLKSQRLIGRTIRRAKMMGIIPTLSKSLKRYF